MFRSGSGQPANSMSRRLWRFFVLAGLLVATVIYWGKGFFGLTYHKVPVDLRERWVEQQYLYKGQNPNDVFLYRYAQTRGLPLPQTERDRRVDPAIGPPIDAAYPPWALFSNVAFQWPGWPAVRIYFALVNLLALAFLALWAYRLGRPFGRTEAITLALVSTALSSYGTTLEVGQVGILVVALLAGALWAEERKSSYLAGLLLGAAMLKPTLSGPFLIPFLVQKRFRTLATAGTYLIGSSLVIWAITKTNPLEMLSQMVSDSYRYMKDGYGPVNVLLAVGVAPQIVTGATALAVCLCATALMVARARRSLLVLFAIAGVAGRFWAYHKHYDNLILIFLLLMLGRVAFEDCRVMPRLFFVLVGLTLWSPGFFGNYLPFQVLQSVLWIGGLAVVFIYSDKPPPEAVEAPYTAEEPVLSGEGT